MMRTDDAIQRRMCTVPALVMFVAFMTALSCCMLAAPQAHAKAFTAKGTYTVYAQSAGGPSSATAKVAVKSRKLMVNGGMAKGAKVLKKSKRTMRVSKNVKCRYPVDGKAKKMAYKTFCEVLNGNSFGTFRFTIKDGKVVRMQFVQ